MVDIYNRVNLNKYALFYKPYLLTVAEPLQI